MFDDPIFVRTTLVFLAVGVCALFWWQDFDGIRSAWEYHRRIRRRPRLTGAEFYRRFYADSTIPAELVVAVRDFHASFWGENPELLRPEDDLLAVNAVADFAGWAAEVEDRFGVQITERVPPDLRAAFGTPDQTFDTLLKIIHLLGGRLRPAERLAPGQTSHDGRGC